MPWLYPALGLAFIGSAGPTAGALGLPLRTIAWPLVLLASVGLLFLVRDGGSGRWLRAHAPALAVGMGAFVLAAAPLAYQGSLTTIGTSIDAISYNVRAEYVQDHALAVPEVPAGQPWLGWVAAQIGLIRVGDIYFLGFSSLVLFRRSFEILSVIAALAHAYAALGSYFFTRVGLRGSRRVGVLAASFVALNSTLIWPGLDCSFSQALALSLVPICLGVAAVLFRRPSTRLAVVLGVLLSGLLTVYPVYAVVLGAGVGLLGISSVAFFPRPRLRWRRARALMLAGVVSAAANPVGAARAVRELTFVGGMLGEGGVSVVGAGNILVYPPVSELFGLVSHAAASHGSDVGGPLVLVAAILAALAALLALRGLVLGGPVRSVAPLSFLVAAGGLAFHQRFVVNSPAGYPYGYYKAVTLLALVLAPLLAAGLAGSSTRRRFRPWAYALVTVLLLLSASRTLWTLRFAATTQVLASTDLLEAARAAARASHGRPIEVIVEPGPRENWLGYLLRAESVVFPGGNTLHPVGVPLLPAAPVLALLDESRPSSPYATVRGGRRSKPVWKGPRYRLVEWTDGRLAEWPVSGIDRWEKGRLRATLDRTGHEVRLDFGGAAAHGYLPGVEVRTVQLGILAPAGATLVAAGEELRVAAGTWLIDWDTSCPAPFELGLSRGVVVPGSVILLDAATGETGRCVEVLPNPQGYLEWRGAVANQVLSGEIELVPPSGGPPAAFRIGVHVGGGQPARNGWWGVFSLDFPSDGLPHRAAMRIDLVKRVGTGWIDGAKAPLEEVAKEITEGRFEATLALWKVRPSVQQLVTANVLTFEAVSYTHLTLPTSDLV